VKLQLGLDVLRSYKRLPYTHWHALAEFVDNSTQSYFNNKAALDVAYVVDSARLEVSIVYDKEGPGLLRISDNAMGMSYEELEKALHVGLPPDNAEGRSRYGLGMKMAASWFGNEWQIVTKKLGETTEYTVSLNVEKIASGDEELQESRVEGLDPSQHYTRIEIRDLNRKPQGRTLGKIKEFLSGIYRLDIQRDTMRLLWQGVPLTYDVSWTFLKDTLGHEYRKDFDFEVNGKRAWGWVAVLDQGGRPKAGFAIVHKDRMVQTWPDAWHPESLYGQLAGSNDLVNQRLVGEIHLDAFDVSHTKDDIHWQDDEEDQVQDKLKEICGEYRDVAKRSRKKEKLNAAAIAAAAKALQSELNSPELLDLVAGEPPSDENVAADEQALIAETDTTEVDFKATIRVRGVDVTILGILDTTKSPNDPYVISEATDPDRVLIVINMNHPHIAEIDENGLLNYFRHCTYDALAEWRARNQAQTVDPGTIKRLKDDLLRLSFDIEMHADDE
jgi:hypothetical protein